LSTMFCTTVADLRPQGEPQESRRSNEFEPSCSFKDVAEEGHRS
jgi:hypothetical protein